MIEHHRTVSSEWLGHLSRGQKGVLAILSAFIAFMFFIGGFALIAGAAPSARDLRHAAVLALFVVVAFPLLMRILGPALRAGSGRREE